jgi:hypothetical protein
MTGTFEGKSDNVGISVRSSGGGGGGGGIPSADIQWTTGPNGKAIEWTRSPNRMKGYAKNSGAGCATGIRWRLRTYGLGDGTWAGRGAILDDVRGWYRNSTGTVFAGETFTYESYSFYRTFDYFNDNPDTGVWGLVSWTWTNISCSNALLPHDASVGGQGAIGETHTSDSRPGLVKPSP